MWLKWPRMQFRILRQRGTERPGSGEYENYKQKGVYSCAGCGTPLYKSDTKFNSGCGWPAFFDGVSDPRHLIHCCGSEYRSQRSLVRLPVKTTDRWAQSGQRLFARHVVATLDMYSRGKVSLFQVGPSSSFAAHIAYEPYQRMSVTV